MNNILQTGLVLLQIYPYYAVRLDPSHKWHGWLFWKHPDGQYVSKRKLEGWEIGQAEDQRDSGIIKNFNDEAYK